MSAIPEDVPFLFCKGESSYKYFDLNINDEELVIELVFKK